MLYTLYSHRRRRRLWLDLARIRNQIVRHRLVEVVLREAGVESHDALELLVLADGDVDGRLDDEPSDCFRARGRGQRAGVGVDCGFLGELRDGSVCAIGGVSG